MNEIIFFKYEMHRQSCNIAAGYSSFLVQKNDLNNTEELVPKHDEPTVLLIKAQWLDDTFHKEEG